MASPKRQSGPFVEDSLFEEFYGFSFYKAVNLLETLYPDRKPLGQTLEPDSEAFQKRWQELQKRVWTYGVG